MVESRIERRTHSRGNERDQSGTLSSRLLVHGTTGKASSLGVTAYSLETSYNRDLRVVLEVEGGVEKVALFKKER